MAVPSTGAPLRELPESSGRKYGVPLTGDLTPPPHVVLEATGHSGTLCHYGCRLGVDRASAFVEGHYGTRRLCTGQFSRAEPRGPARQVALLRQNLSGNQQR